MVGLPNEEGELSAGRKHMGVSRSGNRRGQGAWRGSGSASHDVGFNRSKKARVIFFLCPSFLTTVPVLLLGRGRA